MKTIPLADTTPVTGRHYWRGLDQLAETPEFKQFLEREFPENASEWTDPVSRRYFVKIMSASFALAGIGLGATGCRRPEDKLMPFGKAVENYTHGTSQYYATAMPTRGGAIPLVAKSYEGRPVKLEGNPLFPDANGATDRFAQASILNLYDPDRAARFAQADSAGKLQTAERLAALDALKGLAKKFAANQGEGLALLGERTHSPSRQRLQQELAAKLPKARWFSYEAIDTEVHQRAATKAFGQPAQPIFRYDRASVMLALDCDFIGTEEDAHNNIRRFTQGRKIEKPEDKLNRLYAVESLFTLTGLNADHRLRLPAGQVAAVARAILDEVNGKAATGLPDQARWISECAKDLKANRGRSLVVAGYRQPLAVHLLAHAINAALGNIGTTVELIEAPTSGDGSLTELAALLNGGQVDTLVIVGGNPVYNAPADVNWAAAQARARTVIRLGYYEDETAADEKQQARCHWHFPMAHYLESWGDARTSDGTLVPVQPLILPLFGGLTELEFLARLAGQTDPSGHQIVRATFAKLTGQDSDKSWNLFLHDGFAPGTAAKKVSAKFDASVLSEASAATSAPGRDSLEVVLHRDAKLDDGRYANNGWLQELPDPITKLVWDNVVLLSRKTAHELGVQNHDIVEVAIGERKIKGAVWTQPGMADYSLGLALGYGRTRVGRVGIGTGFDAYPLFTTQTRYLATGATLRKTGGQYPLSCTQMHWSMEGRGIVREANLEQFKAHPDFAEKMSAPEPPRPAGAKEWPQPMYPNPFDAAKKAGHHQWGMSVDLNSCVGCGVCVLACQSENNIPIVGKDLVNRGREMQWMRIDRYYASSPKKHRLTGFGSETYRRDEAQQFEDWIDDVQAVNQPMFCQHCEAAPCENVCPVNATTHDQEGLNVMVYNRCVGTRYCSNNCPYKVRRFNYLDYNKRPLKDLKGPFYPTTLLHSTEGEWDLARWWRNQDATMRPEEEVDLIRMLKNPDVTVRMRGVMEKCSYCVQRIEGAKIAQKVKAGESGDVLVPDGMIKTACQQACPAEAIVFGNIADPNSRVSKLKAQERNYSVLGFLATKPRTTYLARVRNPNPAMPDYDAAPLTFLEFESKNGNPFGGHGGHGASEAATESAAGKGAHQ